MLALIVDLFACSGMVMFVFVLALTAVLGITEMDGITATLCPVLNSAAAAQSCASAGQGEPAVASALHDGWLFTRTFNNRRTCTNFCDPAAAAAARCLHLMAADNDAMRDACRQLRPQKQPSLRANLDQPNWAFV
jgi:hypothetical protein